MKVGIVVPYSWSFWGAVVEHAELQADALRRLGAEAWVVIGNDPPGQFTRVLHPRVGRHDSPPPGVIPVGRSVIVPANGSLPNIILSPRAVYRIRRLLDRRPFDVIHVHEPMTPVVGAATVALAQVPLVATFHASGDLRWMRFARPLWGFLADRLDARIAVSEAARHSVLPHLPGDYEIIPNGVLVPPRADPDGREDRILFANRHEARKGLHVLLRAWPRIRQATGARLGIAGADPLRVRLLISRLGIDDKGIDVLGFLSQDDLTAHLLAAKALVSPSLGGESFGMVLTRAFACATPVVASDIPGYRDVMSPDAGVLVPPGDEAALVDGVAALLGDEERRRALGAAARRLAQEKYAWDRIGRRLLDVYERVTDGAADAAERHGVPAAA